LLIVDDQFARMEAVKLGVPVIGSLGIFARSRERGLIARIASLIRGMRDNGIYFSNHLVEPFLEELEETEEKSDEPQIPGRLLLARFVGSH